MRLPPVEPGHVVGLGALCDLGPRGADETRSRSFSVSEFVTLDDGRRVILHAERGFTIGWRSTRASVSDAPWPETVERITRHVLNVVLPDDDECREEHPWSWLAGLARARGLDVSADHLRGLEYQVVLTDRVSQSLASD